MKPISDYECFVRTILGDPSNYTAQLVFADWLEDRGDADLPDDLRNSPPLISGGDGDGGDGYGGGGDGDGDDCYGGGGGGGCGGGYGGDGDGDGDGDGGGDSGDGDGYGYGGGGDAKHRKEIVSMDNGAYILSIRSSYYPYVIVGSVEVVGFDLNVSNCRIIRRFGNSNSISKLAKNGPMTGTQLLDPSDLEIVYRPNVSRAIPITKAVLKKFMDHA